ncbi:MAG: hypothetical protein WDN00_11790 [Limisphaerales bacterium]
MTLGTGTNAFTATRTVFSWPVNGGTNYSVEYTTRLNPAAWYPLLNPAAIVGSNLVLTNFSPDVTRFYRLRPGSVALVANPLPGLTIQVSSTNTLLVSWPATFNTFLLQETADLASSNWVNNTNAVSIISDRKIVVAPFAARRFYRLITP